MCRDDPYQRDDFFKNGQQNRVKVFCVNLSITLFANESSEVLSSIICRTKLTKPKTVAATHK